MIPLSENKIRDIISLVDTNIIPQYYRHFYESLKNK